ncbi:MAG TPA: KGG domain-containing protein [Polyangiaceae bacterium]|nr:KGG domain-containing protein [Polyangiaceae bacterium]
MSTRIQPIDLPSAPKTRPSTAGAAPNPQSPQDVRLMADQPPVRSGGYDEILPKNSRGFAGMDRRLVRAIARMGGRAAHSAGTAHEFTSEEARIAGRMGGRASQVNRRKRVQEHGAPRPRDGK